MQQHDDDRKMPPEADGADARPEISEADYLKAAAAATDRAAEAGPVAVDPDVAEYMGAFEEDALTAEDAADSLFDAEAGDEH